MITTKTPSGIKRPTKAVFVNHADAVAHARNLNATKGRGYRALKAADGRGSAVVFRPAVANNRQRRVREVI
jgi:hypothetical protein